MKCQERSVFHKTLPHFCWTNMGALGPGELAVSKTECASSWAFTLVRQTGNKPVNRSTKCGKRWSIPQANDSQNKTRNSEEYSWSSNPPSDRSWQCFMSVTSHQWAPRLLSSRYSLNKSPLLELTGLHWAFWLVYVCLWEGGVRLPLAFVCGLIS